VTGSFKLVAALTLAIKAGGLSSGAVVVITATGDKGVVKVTAAEQNLLMLKEISQGSKSHSAPYMPKYFNYFPYFHE
jgi:hypothetical protein